MADLIGFLGDVFAWDIGTIGTTQVTLGWLAAGSAILFMAIAGYKKVKGR